MLEKTHYKTINRLNNLTEGHILYIFEDVEEYIKNVVDFVNCGLEENQYCIIIENDRINLMLQDRLAKILNKSQLSKVVIINNFDFYYAKGDFQCNSIFEYLPKLIENFSEEIPVRSWAHVEWRDEGEIHQNLSASEKEADVIVSQERLLSVCAYDSERVSGKLKESLINHHNFLLKND
ncbi:MEDS domain-containing protein [Bacillus sp. AK031]